jgi:hypothetical protein
MRSFGTLLACIWPNLHDAPVVASFRARNYARSSRRDACGRKPTLSTRRHDARTLHGHRFVKDWQVRGPHSAVAITGAFLAVLAAGCAATIDGFEPGGLVKCSPPLVSDPVLLERSCAGDLGRATKALDEREPGHSAIIEWHEFADGRVPSPIDVTGDGPVPTPNSAPTNWSVTVFVFTLADGSKRATGVLCVKDLSTHQSSCTGIGSYPG